jgi:hypothetical protein
MFSRKLAEIGPLDKVDKIAIIFGNQTLADGGSSIAGSESTQTPYALLLTNNSGTTVRHCG